MKKIAFFDFDGTITDKDTMLELIKFSKGITAFYAGFLANAAFLIGLKLKLVSNQRTKEKVLTHFFKGMELAGFQQMCDRFIDEKLSAFIRPGALHEIKTLQSKGFEIAIVSASAENWIRKWSDNLNISSLASRLEVVDGKLSGNLAGLNCHGDEKVNRIRAAYNLSLYEEIYCYGDSSGDKQMLKLATRAFYKPFRN